jgi:hypothetical protein
LLKKRGIQAIDAGSDLEFPAQGGKMRAKSESKQLFADGYLSDFSRLIQFVSYR